MDVSELFGAAIYGSALLAIWLVYTWRRRGKSRRSERLIQVAETDGLKEPASLHPLINESHCLGCAVCVDACPEKDVLGMLHGKAVLATPANCIGHGACKEVCPTEAITLVLGTETRGVDIPVVGEDFQTNVPHIYVAGELGGMGLIRNAIEQGRQAIEALPPRSEDRDSDVLDVIIIGAGPAGFSASLTAKKRGMRYLTLEQESLGGTVAHYPRGKIVMTAPVDLPLYGKVKMRETTKEALLELWTEVARKTAVEIRYEQQVTAVERVGQSFRVETNAGVFTARSVVLAIGRRGTPRKLGVPGEDLAKVVYRLIDPEQYRGQHVLVVGGGDSALEAAASLADFPDTKVTLSYRRDAFGRAKAKNRERVEAARRSGNLHVALGSEVVGISDKSVALKVLDETRGLRNDAVIVCAGGVLPTPFLESMGVEIETKRGTA